MRYYHICQNRDTYGKTPEISGIFHTLPRKDVKLENSWNVHDLHVKLSANSFEPFDFLDRNLILISPKLDGFLRKHETEYITRKVHISLNNGNKGYRYLLPVFRELDCVDWAKSEIAPDNHRPHIINFDSSCEIPYKVFRLKNAKFRGIERDVIIIDEDIYRDIRYAGLRGIVLTEINHMDS